MRTVLSCTAAVMAILISVFIFDARSEAVASGLSPEAAMTASLYVAAAIMAILISVSVSVLTKTSATTRRKLAGSYPAAPPSPRFSVCDILPHASAIDHDGVGSYSASRKWLTETPRDFCGDPIQH